MPYYGWNAIIFILVVVLIQMIHDILLYYLVILPIPKGHNSIIDMYKVYAEENGFAIIPGDSMLHQPKRKMRQTYLFLYSLKLCLR